MYFVNMKQILFLATVLALVYSSSLGKGIIAKQTAISKQVSNNSNFEDLA